MDHQPEPEDIEARHFGDLLRSIEEQAQVVLYRERAAWVHAARMLAPQGTQPLADVLVLVGSRQMGD
jgi:hypothetical protein